MEPCTPGSISGGVHSTPARRAVRRDHARPPGRGGPRAGDAARGLAKRAQAPRPVGRRTLARRDRPQRLPALGPPERPRPHFGRAARRGGRRRRRARRARDGPRPRRADRAARPCARRAARGHTRRARAALRRRADTGRHLRGLGISVDAVSMRLTRGKAALRRILASELRDEAEAHGLAAPTGRRPRLVLRMRRAQPRAPVRRDLAFRCAGCTSDARATGREFDLGNPFFASLLGASSGLPAVWRGHRLVGRVLRGRRHGRGTRCGARGAGAPLRARRQDQQLPERRGLYAECGRCGEVVSSSAAALASRSPRGGGSPRPPTRPRGSGGREAHRVRRVVIGHQAVLGRARLDVVLAWGRSASSASTKRPRPGSLGCCRCCAGATSRCSGPAADLGRRRLRALRGAAVLRLHANRLDGCDRRDDRRGARALHPAPVLRRVFVDRWDRGGCSSRRTSCRPGAALLCSSTAAGCGSCSSSARPRRPSPPSRPRGERALPTLRDRDLVVANALNALNNRLGRLVGVPVGGLLLGAAGLESVVIVDCATFVSPQR